MPLPKPTSPSPPNIAEVLKQAFTPPDKKAATAPPTPAPASPQPSPAPATPAPVLAGPAAPPPPTFIRSPSQPAPDPTTKSQPTTNTSDPSTISAARPTTLQRPSWIGPPRTATPGIAAMKQPVTLEYASAGLKPPVYAFTSLSDPQWDAVEMDKEKKDNGEYRFYKTFQAEEGEYQYKFRLGPGDWWVLDDSKPTVGDGAGNKNNQIIVMAAAPAPPADTSAPQPQKPEASNDKAAGDLKQFNDRVANDFKQFGDKVKDTLQPKLDKPSAIQLPPAVSQPENVPTPAPAPLMKHETLFPETKTSDKHIESKPDVDDEDDQAWDDREDEDEAEEEMQHSPLMRHESVHPASQEQDHAPLMRHETGGLGVHHDDDTQLPVLQTRRSSAEDPIPEEADANDPSLERFPTDSQGILEHIQRTSTQIAEDETTDEILNSGSEQADKSPSSLPSVPEDEDEELEGLREQAEANAKNDADEVDPSAEMPEVPMVMVMEPQRPAGPITPPMTPQEAEKIVEEMIEEAEEERREMIVEQLIEREVEREKEEAEVVSEFVQERGVLGTVMDVAMSPMAWLAIAGIALAVAGGVFKLRYA